MPPAGFEPTIPVSERPQTYALDRAATGTDKVIFSFIKSRFNEQTPPPTTCVSVRVCFCIFRDLPDYPPSTQLDSSLIYNRSVPGSVAHIPLKYEFQPINIYKFSSYRTVNADSFHYEEPVNAV